MRWASLQIILGQSKKCHLSKQAIRSVILITLTEVKRLP
uniref:Uncharacterized protein n=1 Tax=Arundo donax TaxID=35708 RepID=A0A0A8YFN2_ARUDO